MTRPFGKAQIRMILPSKFPGFPALPIHHGKGLRTSLMIQRQSRKNLILKDTEPLAPDKLYQFALRLLTGRDYAVARIRQKLAARAAAEQDVDAVIATLQREGWLDDARYAARFAEAAITSGRYYGVRLRMEMRRRGFLADVVNETLAPLLAERDE